jgi:hypothetical protein
MRVFYSHPIKLYGTDSERRAIALIGKRFPGYEVVDPSADRSARGEERETEYYLGLVDSCDCLVFSRLFGYVTEGVRPEVEHAISKGMPVYELRDGRFIPVTGRVANLPIMERLILRAKEALGRGRGSP